MRTTPPLHPELGDIDCCSMKRSCAFVLSLHLRCTTLCSARQRYKISPSKTKNKRASIFLKIEAVAYLCSDYCTFLLFAIFENIAWLAVQLTTQCIECREAYGSALAGLYNREICRCNMDTLSEFGKRNSAPSHHRIEFYNNCHSRSKNR